MAPVLKTVSWRSLAASLAALCGLGIATYLTIAHYSPGTLSCPLGSASHAINCLKVTTSAQSIVFGVPVAVLGLAFFVVILPLSLPFAWRSRSLLVARTRLVCAVVGIGFVFYLLYSELFTIKAICLWCTCVHVLTFIWFVLVVTGWDDQTTNAIS